MVEAELFLELLASLLADPARFDRRGQCPEIGVGREVGQIVFRSPEARRSPTSQTSSPGICCMPLSPIRCGGPSATRTRTAAKRAFRGPLVPLRQASVRHFAWVSMSSARNGEDIGHMAFARAAARGHGKDEFDVARVDLLMTGNSDGPG